MTDNPSDLLDLPLARFPVQARSRHKVTRALDAAEAIAATEGLGAVNLTRVADEAGLSVGALYQYLPSGETIAAALVARYHRRLEATMATFLHHVETAPGVNSVARLGGLADAVLTAIIAVFEQEQDLRGLRQITGPEVAAARFAHKRRMQELVATMLRSAGVSDERAAPASAVIFGGCDAALHACVDDPAAAQELRRFLHAYLATLMDPATAPPQELR